MNMESNTTETTMETMVCPQSPDLAAKTDLDQINASDLQQVEVDHLKVT